MNSCDCQQSQPAESTSTTRSTPVSLAEANLTMVQATCGLCRTTRRESVSGFVVNAHSKWLGVFPKISATSFATIQHLRQLFAQFGVPETIVTINSTQFTAGEFKQFCTRKVIHHVLVTPYHPSSNRLAERAVRIIEQGFHKLTAGTISNRISYFLLQYRITPHTMTSLSPAELLVG